MKTEEQSGAICGGVISESKYQSDPWAYMMATILPDDKYKKYIAFTISATVVQPKKQNNKSRKKIKK